MQVTNSNTLPLCIGVPIFYFLNTVARLMYIVAFTTATQHIGTGVFTYCNWFELFHRIKVLLQTNKLCDGDKIDGY